MRYVILLISLIRRLEKESTLSDDVFRYLDAPGTVPCVKEHRLVCQIQEYAHRCLLDKQGEPSQYTIDLLSTFGIRAAVLFNELLGVNQVQLRTAKGRLHIG